MNMNDRKKRRRKAYVKAIRVGTILGLIVFTAYLTVRLAILALDTLQARAGAAGGEIFVLPMIVLLVWAGWSFRKEYDSLKRGEDQNDVNSQCRIIPTRCEK